MTRDQKLIENPGLFVLVGTLLFFSIILLLYGFIKPPKSKTQDNISGNQEKEVEVKDDESLSKYFENAKFTDEEKNESGYYLETDPFRETCDKTNVGKKPVGSFGTICYQ